MRKYKYLYPTYPDNLDKYEGIISNHKKYKVPVDRPVRIYCDGVYDVFHYGHARSLRQAKYLFPNVHLIAGVTSDKLTEELKGATVFDETERAESLAHCKYVDEIIENVPWIITDEFIKNHKIDFIAHDDAPYSHGDCADIYEKFKRRGVFIPIMRTKGISTSGIITKVVRDYDRYVLRNLDRGCTPKELNISFLQLNRLKMEKHVDKILKDVDIRLNSIKIELRIANKYWDRVIHRFLEKVSRLRGDNGNILEKIKEFIR